MEAVDRQSNESEVIAEQDKSINSGHLVALIVLAATVAAAPLVTARHGFAGFVIAYAISVMAWAIARRARLRFAVVVVMAIALRAMMLFAPPLLSNDVYRYLWDGRTLAAGGNPYAAIPNDPRVNHPEIRTIYPPHAELLFAAVHNLTAWRLLLIAADVVALFLLREQALAYALFPPLIFEGAWSGHIEPIAATLLLLAWRYDSAIAAALSSGLKIIPLAAMPALVLRSRHPKKFVIVFAAVLLVPAIPFLLAGPVMPGMRDYATRWVFNSPLYDAVITIIDGLRLDAHLRNAWALIQGPPFGYAYLYPDFLARCVLAVMAAALIIRFRRDPAASIGALLICSPAIHPWYWLALAPFASGVWLWLAVCAPFSYLLYAGASKWVVYALCYALPMLIARLPLSGYGTSDAGWHSAVIRSRTAGGTSPR
jgi:hypothetical protein